MASVPHTGVEMQCPVSLALKRNSSDFWTLPIEPTVSARASKTIVKRQIQSTIGRVGSVKEEWSQDDYQITVSGLFQSGDGTYPAEEVAELNDYLRKGQPLQIRCLLLETLGITQMIVESWEFPETSGLENQRYSFTGYSDEDIDLLV